MINSVLIKLYIVLIKLYNYNYTALVNKKICNIN